MSLTEKVMVDLKEAMKAKDEVALRSLRAIKSAILLAQTDKGVGAEITADDEMKLLQKLAKQRKESLEVYKTQGREDLAKGEQEELAIIEKFLPKQLSAEEIEAELKGIIKQLGATSAAETGKVMGVASKHFAGRADNKMVSEVLKKLLA